MSETTNTQRPPMRGPGGAGAYEKPKSLKKGLVKLAIYCKKYIVPIIFVMICAIVASILSLIGPNKLSKITDLISSGLISGTIDMAAIMNIGIFLVIIYSVSMLLSYLQGYIMADVSQKLAKNMREMLSKKINILPLKYFDSTTYGDILSRVTNDVDTMGMTLNQSLPTLITSVVMFFGSLIMMFVTNWIMAISAFAATFIGFGLSMFIIAKSQKYFVQQQRELGRLNGHIEETYSGQQVVKAYNAEKSSIEKFDKCNSSLYNCAWKAQYMSGLMGPLMGFIGNFGYVVVCIVGAVLVLKDKISFGVIVAFMVYVRLFSQPLSQMAQAATSLQSAAAATERVVEFLEEGEMQENSTKTIELKDVKGHVAFDHVKFGYNEDKIIIPDFSIDINPGQKVAIVGSTGAGKTTLVNLLMRFYELNGGEIKVDGVSISELTRKNVHDIFCMVLQDTWIFEGSIRDNIVYSKKGVQHEELVDVCKKVGLHSYIKTLPDGYDTVLNDSISLSAGQKQLITIARAMIENAPLLILDEATSSVDTRTEILIQNAMDKLTHGRTSFVIAHRLSTIKNSDLILVMKDGNIVESGNHEELIAKEGVYAELYNSQFEVA